MKRKDSFLFFLSLIADGLEILQRFKIILFCNLFFQETMFPYRQLPSGPSRAYGVTPEQGHSVVLKVARVVLPIQETLYGPLFMRPSFQKPTDTGILVYPHIYTISSTSSGHVRYRQRRGLFIISTSTQNSYIP